jgi:hypothetical protein
VRDSDNAGREFDSRFNAAFQPGYDDLSSVDFSDLDAFGTVSGEPVATEARARPLVDRFVVAIWIAGGALLVFGIVGYALLAANVTGQATGVSGAYVFIAIVSTLAPWLLALGIATLVGSLFLLASRWERRS